MLRYRRWWMGLGGVRRETEGDVLGHFGHLRVVSMVSRSSCLTIEGTDEKIAATS